MAGMFEVDGNGKIIKYDNYSGHYKPEGPGLKEISTDALNSNGFDVTGADWKTYTWNK